jgi:sulfite dehydrogenase (quinone) subunit SoeC
MAIYGRRKGLWRKMSGSDLDDGLPDTENTSPPRAMSPGDSETLDALSSYPAVVLRVLGATGYGLWMVLGTALALGIYSDGRGEVLAPLFTGLVLVSLSLLATCLRLKFALEWHGWNPLQNVLPTREGMIAMANYLPMLAVAGLARGENDFWATRVAGLALMLCSLASLIYTSRGACRRLFIPEGSVAAMLPVGRIVAALFAGGLWFWLCVALQTADGVESMPSGPWRLLLLAVALAIGIVDGTRWQALRRPDADMAQLTGLAEIRIMLQRFMAAVLAVGLPCLLLAINTLDGYSAAFAAVAAVSCTVGQCVEQRLYCAVHAHLGTDQP